ncbi:MAG: bifunctional 2-C-methyl-D-erythritol 4-phosphate cytidylyltransferase/2-C-methyl-D-erythritol 2,4-cyclodiphosphate synthase [Rhodospirillaceae bacterium]|nr:bifunctional 2-C-methyl-D-erythritol 4-phosphate cytidylyltransferase/2-C-methyl-D-erythritol 2,4-cyclodiphosphate synthase [Rhodospirillaceae bacterium]
MTGCLALIVAAGRGQRFGADVPKQYAPLGPATVLGMTARAFLAHPGIDGVRCVIHEDDRDLYARSVEGLNLLEPVVGGATRQQSVLSGLESLSELNPQKILIHDAARPFVSSQIIDDVIAALDDQPGAIPAVAVSDTLKHCEDGRIQATVSRDALYRAQTPQGFRYREILEAHHRYCDREMTDDAQLFEEAGIAVAEIAGEEGNFKITTAEDHARAQMMFGATDIRTGFGYDVHRLVDGDAITLCGVTIQSNRALKGHSDADVALHALCDALLGAMGEGDIGSHFPPGDARWQNAPSAIFVEHAIALLVGRGGRLINADITIVCEAPKIGPHREEMCLKMAEILGVERHRVSLKATTTEGLGATGRGEGIAAQAVVSLALPNPA